jgi:hypothetical protein
MAKKKRFLNDATSTSTACYAESVYSRRWRHGRCVIGEGTGGGKESEGKGNELSRWRRGSNGIALLGSVTEVRRIAEEEEDLVRFTRRCRAVAGSVFSCST